MFQVDLRELTRSPVETAGELAPTHPIFAGLDFVLTGPVRVRGRLHGAGEGRFYWNAQLSTQITAPCRRCLVEVRAPVNAVIGALFARDLEASDDPDAYPVPPDATAIDLTPAVREELILATPQYVLCREECRGLCPRCGHDLNDGPCGCAAATDPRWAALEGLKGQQRG
jgi:uncharacterized protein